MFTDFCVEFIFGFVFCKRRGKEMVESERRFLIIGGSFKYGGNESKLVVRGWDDGDIGSVERGRVDLDVV